MAAKVARMRTSQDGHNAPLMGRARALASQTNAVTDLVPDCDGVVALEFAIILIPLLYS